MPPRTTLRFVSEGEHDSGALDDDADLYIGSVQKFGADIKVQTLFTTHFTAWPAAGTRSSTAPSRRAVSPPMNTSRGRGRSHGPIDEALAEQGLSRHVALITPTFYAAIFALADSDLILPAMPSHLLPGVKRLGLDLRAFDVPIDMPAVTVVQAWPPRLDSDPAHRWLRQTIKQVCSDASEAADAAP